MTLLNPHMHRLSIIRKWLFNLAVLAVIALGVYLMALTVMQALWGENKALWLLISFTAVMAVTGWFFKRFWVLTLDDRDTLDIFKIASINAGAHLAHFQREHFQNAHIVTERGYSFTVRDGETQIRTSLVFLGKEYADRKTVIGEQALLTLSIRVGQPFRMAIVNPLADIRESLDVEFYAPAVLHSKKYSYQKYGIVFSDYDKDAIQTIFEDPFLQTQLIELFQRYKFKFAVIDDRKTVAVKTAAVETVALDVEAYPVLMNISQLISTQHKKYITQ